MPRLLARTADPIVEATDEDWIDMRVCLYLETVGMARLAIQDALADGSMFVVPAVPVPQTNVSSAHSGTHAHAHAQRTDTPAEDPADARAAEAFEEPDEW